MLADESFELADHLARGAEVEPGGELVLDETEMDLLEAGTVWDDPLAVTGGGEDLAAEQRQRSRARLQHGGGVTGASKRGGLSGGVSSPTLRIVLTLYAVDGGKVLWAATTSCPTFSGAAENAGLAMIDTIFDQADKNRIADAGCPL